MDHVQKPPANWVYYSVVGNGEWSGEFSFQITSRKLFWRDRIGFWNRLFSMLMHLKHKIAGPSKILSSLKVYPHVGPAGVITNLVIIKSLGITLYVLKEHYVLHPGGEKLYVNSRERLGPVPFLFKSSKRHPAHISENGMKARYSDMPILGTLWTGDYQVGDGQDYISSVLSCPWARATETIIKIKNGPPVEQKFFLYPKSVNEVIASLRLYRDWYDSNKDPRATFTHAYLLITESFFHKIPSKGFQDAEWVNELVVAFASEYLRAVLEYDMGVLEKGGWKHVFEVILSKKTSVFEELVLSMGAHIIQDLPLALHNTAWEDQPESSRIADFHLANDILGEAIEDIQSEVSTRYNGFLRWLDRLGNKDDEVLTNYGIRISRGMAWYNAIRLKSDHEMVKESLSRSVQAVTKQVTSPPFSLSFLFRIIRFISQLTRRWPRPGKLIDKRGRIVDKGTISGSGN